MVSFCAVVIVVYILLCVMPYGSMGYDYPYDEVVMLNNVVFTAEQTHVIILVTLDFDITTVSCQNGPICHAWAWQVGPLWQGTLDQWITTGYIWETYHLWLRNDTVIHYEDTLFLPQPHLPMYTWLQLKFKFIVWLHVLKSCCRTQSIFVYTLCTSYDLFRMI